MRTNPTDAMSRACPGARAHTARISGPSRFAQAVRWENIFVKAVFPIIQWINRCYAAAVSRASSRTNLTAYCDAEKCLPRVNRHKHAHYVLTGMLQSTPVKSDLHSQLPNLHFPRLEHPLGHRGLSHLAPVHSCKIHRFVQRWLDITNA